MLHSKFTKKIILLAIVPIGIFFVSLLNIQIFEMKSLSSSTSQIAKDGLQKIYKSYLENRSNDIADKVLLKLDIVHNELNIVAGMAQKIIDEKGFETLGKKLQNIEYLRNNFEYNAAKNWSNLAKHDIDISMSVWGYLHDKDGKINRATIDYTTSMSSIKTLLSAVGDYGIKKGWLYITGPKKTPVMIMTPWAQMPAIFDKKYPGHNTNNWWDFFFPGIVEGWENWINTPSSKPKNINNEITLTPLYEDAGGTGLMVTFFAPLWNKERTKNEGSAALDYHIDNVVNLVVGETVAETGFSFLLQSNGNVLGMQDNWAPVLGLEKEEQKSDDGVHKSYFKLGGSNIPDLRNISDSFYKNDFSVHNITDNEGKEYILSFENVMDFNLWTGNGSEIKKDSLYLGIIVPKGEIFQVQYKIEDEINKVSEKTLLFIISISILLGIVTTSIATLYAFRETKQIRLMNEGANFVKKKHFDISIPVVSQDDLGKLAHTFNGMILEIQSTYSQLQNHAEELEAKVKERTLSLQQANEELERLSQVDGLTNIHNRRYLDEHLDKKWREHMRNGLPISAMMIDIDYFKKFNDTYGHQVGDDCLCRVAQVLQNTFKRPTDILARYGGEEFCVIISGDADNAVKIAELLRKAVESLNIEHKPSDKGIVSISIGVNSLIPSQNDNMSKFIEQTDQALYKSKEAGRDQVTLYQ